MFARRDVPHAPPQHQPVCYCVPMAIPPRITSKFNGLRALVEHQPNGDLPFLLSKASSSFLFSSALGYSKRLKRANHVRKNTSVALTRFRDHQPGGDLPGHVGAEGDARHLQHLCLRAEARSEIAKKCCKIFNRRRKCCFWSKYQRIAGSFDIPRSASKNML